MMKLTPRRRSYFDPEIDRARGHLPLETRNANLQGLAFCGIPGGPGRNRTTDTRIFKTDVHFSAKILSYQKRLHQDELPGDGFTMRNQRRTLMKNARAVRRL
jgi:hypothetical protein